MKDFQHLIRVGILALFVIIGFTVIRNIMVPESFGRYGHYRADAIAEEMAYELVYQGSSVCKKCHTEKYKNWSSGRHKVVNCEICHSPANVHIKKPVIKSGTKTIATNYSNALCIRCHLKLPARPHDFNNTPHPQIDVKKHMKGKGRLKCFKCHNPHYPDLKRPEKAVIETKQKASVQTKVQLTNIGFKIYQDKCLTCHGKTGDGKTEAAELLDTKLPDFSSTDYTSTLNQIIKFTQEGKGEDMPAYKDKLSKEEIQAVAEYIQEFRR
jgi:cytochrome c553